MAGLLRCHQHFCLSPPLLPFPLCRPTFVRYEAISCSAKRSVEGRARGHIIDHEYHHLLLTSVSPNQPRKRRLLALQASANHDTPSPADDVDDHARSLPIAMAQLLLGMLTVVYVVWLFLLPYAPGDPVWAIKPNTISVLLDLSLNFFYVLPLSNKLGVHILESPTVHPTAEALFNFVLGWTMMFAPLLFTDRKRDRYSGSLLILWAIQMFLTNTVLIPYMAIRLSGKSRKHTAESNEGIEGAMGSPGGARAVGAVGAMVGLVSVVWWVYGRADEGFGGFSDRWTFFLEYLANDRPGYAFIWDLCLYSLFQPWLIVDNLSNIDESKKGLVRILSFIPFVGLVAYLWNLNPSSINEPEDDMRVGP